MATVREAINYLNKRYEPDQHIAYAVYSEADVFREINNRFYKILGVYVNDDMLPSDFIKARLLIAEEVIDRMYDNGDLTPWHLCVYLDSVLRDMNISLEEICDRLPQAIKEQLEENDNADHT